jgi:hypothetical protein
MICHFKSSSPCASLIKRQPDKPKGDVMDIDFTGEYLVNDQDVTFYAIVNNQTVACIVSTAALVELADPDDEMDAESVFLDHQYKFEEIAEGLILNHKVVDGELHINRGEL